MRNPVRHFTTLLLILITSTSSAQWIGPKVSDSLSIQGYLTNSGGTPIDGFVPITFKLYKGATQVWSQNLASVPVTDGLFSVYVGGNSLDTVAFNQAIDLGIAVDTDPEIVPRTPLVASGFARAIPGFYAFYAEDFNWRTWNVVGGAPNNRIENPSVSVGNTIGGGGGRSTLSSTANVINGDFNTISGGHGNYISTFDATIGGGINNETRSYHSVIGGGYSNLIGPATHDCVIGGGSNNEITSHSAVIGGGSNNTAAGSGSTIGGGSSNMTTNADATIAGGSSNRATGSGSAVGGGLSNRATGIRATVPGGDQNQARGESSFAAGRYARAKHNGTFVWNDLSVADSTVSTADNQFLVRASGGVGIGTDAPEEQLHILEAGGSTGIKLGGDGTVGPNGIVFEDDTDNNGMQLFWRTTSNQLVLERTSQGTGTDGADAFMYDKDDQRFLFSGARNATATFTGHLVGFDNTAGSSSDGIAIRLGASNAGGGNNFISFFDGDNDPYGRIEGNGTDGVSYITTGGDYAEYLPRRHPHEVIHAGDVVAVTGGAISRDTERADRVMVITDRPAVLGNMPKGGDETLYERVAFVGQVPVLTLGPVKSGDYLIPSGRDDGTAVAKRPEELSPADLDLIVGVAWEANPDAGPKKVIAEVGLDRARPTRLAFENELAKLWTIVRAQQERLDALEARGDL